MSNTGVYVQLPYFTGEIWLFGLRTVSEVPVYYSAGYAALCRAASCSDGEHQVTVLPRGAG